MPDPVPERERLRRRYQMPSLSQLLVLTAFTTAARSRERFSSFCMFRRPDGVRPRFRFQCGTCSPANGIFPYLVQVSLRSRVSMNCVDGTRACRRDRIAFGPGVLAVIVASRAVRTRFYPVLDQREERIKLARSVEVLVAST